MDASHVVQQEKNRGNSHRQRYEDQMRSQRGLAAQSYSVSGINDTWEEMRDDLFSAGNMPTFLLNLEKNVAGACRR